MAYLLHFVSPERDITGVDYDEEKIEVANHCFGKNERIRFVASDVMQFSFEKYDGIIMADMLHYLQPEEQKKIIGQSMSSLNPGGKLLIREGNKELEGRHQGTRLTEFFSTSLFGFNKTAPGGLSFLSGNMVRQLAAERGMDCCEIDKTKFTSNVIFVIQRKQ
jgi:uncharacterized protein